METNMKLTFELSVDQANIVMAGLGELPLKIAEPVVALMRQQAAPQMTPVKADTPVLPVD